MTDQNQIEIYQTRDGLTEIIVQLQENTIWLSQNRWLHFLIKIQIL